MKSTSYKCDRCGACLGEDSAAIDRFRFGVHMRISYKLLCADKWRCPDGWKPIAYELCEKCRESLEEWLNENA